MTPGERGLQVTPSRRAALIGVLVTLVAFWVGLNGSGL